MINRLMRSLRRHERTWILVYLFLLLIGLAVLVVPGTRHRALGLLGRAVDAADVRWDTRLAHGLALVDAGAHAEAATYLERLDRDFPAPTNRARRDKDREALLLALARSHEMLGRRGRSLRVYQRLVAFDPRNYRNHYELAAAHVRLARGWSVPEEAVTAFRRVLAINPNHLPSVRAVTRFAYDRGDFPEAVRVLEQYLAASLMQNLRVTVGDSTAIVRVPIDGRWHQVRVLLPPTPGTFVVRVETNGFTMAVGEPRIDLALRTGMQPVALPSRSMAPPQWQGDGASLGAGRYVAVRTNARLFVPIMGEEAPATLVRFDVKLFKPVDPETWTMAEHSYRNLLNEEGLRDAAMRAQPLPAALADSVVPFFLD